MAFDAYRLLQQNLQQQKQWTQPLPVAFHRVALGASDSWNLGRPTKEGRKFAFVSESSGHSSHLTALPALPTHC